MKAWVNIASSEAYLLQNFHSLFVVMPCCLYQAIDTLFQNDAVIFSYIFHTGMVFHLDFLFKFSLQEVVLILTTLAANPKWIIISNTNLNMVSFMTNEQCLERSTLATCLKSHATNLVQYTPLHSILNIHFHVMQLQFRGITLSDAFYHTCCFIISQSVFVLPCTIFFMIPHLDDSKLDKKLWFFCSSCLIFSNHGICSKVNQKT